MRTLGSLTVHAVPEETYKAERKKGGATKVTCQTSCGQTEDWSKVSNPVSMAQAQRQVNCDDCRKTNGWLPQ